jgi:hypothetical protein
MLAIEKRDNAGIPELAKRRFAVKCNGSRPAGLTGSDTGGPFRVQANVAEKIRRRGD